MRTPKIRVWLEEQEVLHILSLSAAHDYRLCRTCDAIVTQVAWKGKRNFGNLGGRGGTPPPPKVDSNEWHEVPTASFSDILESMNE